jgi:asparagine synthase (glutamine-hydrolysing)
VFGAPARAALLGDGRAVGLDPLDAYRDCFDWRRDHLANLLYADLKTWLPDVYLEKVDKATMAVGLEARVPLLDVELVELAGTIPSDLKIRGRELKYVLKRAVADLLPPAILTRPKHGFAVPTDAWFRGPLAGYARELLLGADALSRDLVSAAEVARLLDEHRSGRNVHDSRLWVLLNLELWLRGRRRARAEAAAEARRPLAVGGAGN